LTVSVRSILGYAMQFQRLLLAQSGRSQEWPDKYAVDGSATTGAIIPSGDDRTDACSRTKRKSRVFG
jgi:hypothetical protein